MALADGLQRYVVRIDARDAAAEQRRVDFTRWLVGEFGGLQHIDQGWSPAVASADVARVPFDRIGDATQRRHLEGAVATLID